MNSTSQEQYLASCCAIARDAGKLLMEYFTGEFLTSHKADASPVTDADIAANHLIVNALSKLVPSIPVVAEEDSSHAVAFGTGEFWLVDPLDGTRSFVRGEPEFTVNIGLIRNNKPVLGVIYAPPQDELYWGEVGKGAYRKIGGTIEKVHTRAPSANGMVIVSSKSHPSKATEAYLQTIKVKEIIPGSSSIKFCRVAEGVADIYPRFGRTMEWDTAAGHAILEAAGGRVETAEGKPLTYGKPGFENPGFIAFGYPRNIA